VTKPVISSDIDIDPCGVDFCRVHPPASRASGCFAAISRHEIFRVIALLLAPPPASATSRLDAFRSEPDCSPDVRRREQSRSFKKRNAKNEHDRKFILNASTAEQHRQTGKISKPTAGMENRFIKRMSDTRRHPTLPDTGTGNRLLEFAYHQSSLL
jgi:hypothetical protein